MAITYAVLFFILINSTNGLFWGSSQDVKPIKRNPPKSCPHFDVIQVPEDYQGNMGDLWIVTHIIPKGKSQYVDGTTACGLHNFVQDECKCLRYSISLDENDSIIRKTVGLEVKSQMFRYVESKIEFIEDYFDLFQTQFLMSAAINFEGSKSILTKSPMEEELYAEYDSFALLATDNYETYAVYASCVPLASGPLAWIAFSDEAFRKNKINQALPGIRDVLTKNGIDFNKFISVDQHHCRPKN